MAQGHDSQFAQVCECAPGFREGTRQLIAGKVSAKVERSGSNQRMRRDRAGKARRAAGGTKEQRAIMHIMLEWAGALTWISEIPGGSIPPGGCPAGPCPLSRYSGKQDRPREQRETHGHGIAKSAIATKIRCTRI